MRLFNRVGRVCVLLTAFVACGRAASLPVAAPASAPLELASPIVEGSWIIPGASRPATPIWGHARGLRVGIHPTRGPRGLLRVYAPYLEQPDGRVINFIAVEPIPEGTDRRGLSELERSTLDPRERGKRFWSVEDPGDATPRAPWEPARGKVVRLNEHKDGDGVEALRVFVRVEPFDNGALVYLRLTFRSDRPHEVGIATFADEKSKPLRHCIVTATMGNYARLRDLHLAKRVVKAGELWPDFAGDGFAPHAKFGLEELARTEAGHAIASATPDEARPQDAEYAPRTRPNWRYTGKLATQFWRCESLDPALEVWVNGRRTYWASRSLIPGGVSFENFEMVAPFKQGAEFWFGVTPGLAEPNAKPRKE